MKAVLLLQLSSYVFIPIPKIFCVNVPEINLLELRTLHRVFQQAVDDVMSHDISLPSTRIGGIIEATSGGATNLSNEQTHASPESQNLPLGNTQVMKKMSDGYVPFNDIYPILANSNTLAPNGQMDQYRSSLFSKLSVPTSFRGGYWSGTNRAMDPMSLANTIQAPVDKINAMLPLLRLNSNQNEGMYRSVPFSPPFDFMLVPRSDDGKNQAKIVNTELKPNSISSKPFFSPPKRTNDLSIFPKSDTISQTTAIEEVKNEPSNKSSIADYQDQQLDDTKQLVSSNISVPAIKSIPGTDDKHSDYNVDIPSKNLTYSATKTARPKELPSSDSLDIAQKPILGDTSKSNMAPDNAIEIVNKTTQDGIGIAKIPESNPQNSPISRNEKSESNPKSAAIITNQLNDGQDMSNADMVIKIPESINEKPNAISQMNKTVNKKSEQLTPKSTSNRPTSTMEGTSKTGNIQKAASSIIPVAGGLSESAPQISPNNNNVATSALAIPSSILDIINSKDGTITLNNKLVLSSQQNKRDSKASMPSPSQTPDKKLTLQQQVSNSVISKQERKEDTNAEISPLSSNSIIKKTVNEPIEQSNVSILPNSPSIGILNTPLSPTSRSSSVIAERLIEQTVPMSKISKNIPINGKNSQGNQISAQDKMQTWSSGLSAGILPIDSTSQLPLSINQASIPEIPLTPFVISLPMNGLISAPDFPISSIKATLKPGLKPSEIAGKAKSDPVSDLSNAELIRLEPEKSQKKDSLIETEKNFGEIPKLAPSKLVQPETQSISVRNDIDLDNESPAKDKITIGDGKNIMDESNKSFPGYEAKLVQVDLNDKGGKNDSSEKKEETESNNDPIDRTDTILNDSNPLIMEPRKNSDNAHDMIESKKLDGICSYEDENKICASNGKPNKDAQDMPTLKDNESFLDLRTPQFVLNSNLMDIIEKETESEDMTSFESRIQRPEIVSDAWERIVNLPLPQPIKSLIDVIFPESLRGEENSLVENHGDDEMKSTWGDSTSDPDLYNNENETVEMDSEKIGLMNQDLKSGRMELESVNSPLQQVSNFSPLANTSNIIKESDFGVVSAGLGMSKILLGGGDDGFDYSVSGEIPKLNFFRNIPVIGNRNGKEEDNIGLNLNSLIMGGSDLAMSGFGVPSGLPGSLFPITESPAKDMVGGDEDKLNQMMELESFSSGDFDWDFDLDNPIKDTVKENGKLPENRRNRISKGPIAMVGDILKMMPMVPMKFGSEMGFGGKFSEHLLETNGEDISFARIGTEVLPIENSVTRSLVLGDILRSKKIGQAIASLPFKSIQEDLVRPTVDMYVGRRDH